MNSQITSYSRGLKVEIPSQGVDDVTEALVGGVDGPQKQP